MTYYELSVITNTGFPYYHLILKEPPEGVQLYLRFFDFSEDKVSNIDKLDPVSSFELNAGLVSALFEFARNINKKIENLEFVSRKKEKKKNSDIKYKGDVLITTQTESYLLQKSIKEKIKKIHSLVIAPKIPLDSAYELLQNEEDKIIEILTDYQARKIIEDHDNEINQLANQLLSEMEQYGLKSICINSFDLSPIKIYGKTLEVTDIDEILRNIRLFPEIPPLEWIYRQSFLSDTQVDVYIIKAGVGPTIEGIFETYFYLLICEPESYLGEFPGKLMTKFNQILG